ncbi:MAG: hypothetical protein KatS3mg105_3646 [Gemmatales bacterium]|nr:MAG: hypothetical protein KatS3mg105_3646 [Gemmatales bacterium]
MSHDENWLSLTCPFCQVRFRIKSAYANLAGRCPECGKRIEAPNPQAHAPPTIESALVPLEDEWPEPAQVEGDSTYQLREEEGPASSDAPQAAAPMSIDADTRPYVVGQAGEKGPVPDNAITYTLSRAETDPERKPRPPAKPAMEGIYTYPWRRENFRYWLYLGIGFSLILLGIALFPILMGNTDLSVAGRAFGMLLILNIAAIGIFLLSFGGYGAMVFLAIVEETAAGSDYRDARLEWYPWEGIARLFYLLWIGSWCWMPAFFVSMLVGGRKPDASVLCVLGIILSTTCFPVLLLSSLAANEFWMVLSLPLLRRMLGRLRTVRSIYFPIVIIPFLAAGLVGLTTWNISLVPVAGFALSALWLIYARLLGRLGWLVSVQAPTRRKGRKRAATAKNDVPRDTTIQEPTPQ